MDQALNEMQTSITVELEQRLWTRLEPRIQEALRARHLSIADTAQYLHVSEQTVRRLVRDKEIPFFRVRSQIFLRQTDVDTWIEQHLEGNDQICGDS